MGNMGKIEVWMFGHVFKKHARLCESLLVIDVIAILNLLQLLRKRANGKQMVS